MINSLKNGFLKLRVCLESNDYRYRSAGVKLVLSLYSSQNDYIVSVDGKLSEVKGLFISLQDEYVERGHVIREPFIDEDGDECYILKHVPCAQDFTKVTLDNLVAITDIPIDYHSDEASESMIDFLDGKVYFKSTLGSCRYTGVVACRKKTYGGFLCT